MQNEERADILSTTADSVVEEVLVDEGMAEAIRRMRARGMGKKRIAREMGLDIKTVRKWLKKERGTGADEVRRVDPQAPPRGRVQREGAPSGAR
jgi:uncharacterized protein YjcR